MKYRVGIYLRLSNEDKDKEDESESIKNQRNMLIQYINDHNEFVLEDEYCDEDLSGAGTYRPQFERLIEDCKNNKIDVVLCKSQSRFSRDMEIVEKYINNKFIEWNIRFISLSDNADTLILGNKKSRQINGLINEWFLEDVSNNIRSAFKSKMKEGHFISPFAPFGYEISKSNKNKLEIDQYASEVVKKIFNLYLKGMGFTGIAKYLNSIKIPCPSLYKYQKGIKLNIISNKPREEIKWSSNAIKTILTNEVYLGHLIQGKRTTISYKNHKIKTKDKKEWIRIENTHEAIIDNNTFKKVELCIKERTKPLLSTKCVHLFSGKIFCLECKSYMRKKNTKYHEYLVCSNNCINNKSIRYDILSNIILIEINKLIDKYYDLNELNNLRNNNKLKNKIKSLENQQTILINKINKINNNLKTIYEDKLNGIITLKQFKYLINSYNKDNKNINKQLKTISNEINNYKKQENIDIFSKYIALKELNRTIIQEFINKIFIGRIHNDSRTILIKWNNE